MSPLPKISIVTPSFNQGKYLEKTILSVIEQDYPNLEYIIIDGGSTDNSIEIIKKYEKLLKYWVSEPDRGQSHAINKGFAQATGDLLAWLNSDDYYAPGALKAVAEVYMANPAAGAVVGAGEMVDEAGNRLLYMEPFDVTSENLARWIDQFFWQPSCFFTKEAWEKSGQLDEDIHFAMDLDLWFKISAKFTFATTREMLSSSLRHSDAKTNASGDMARMDAIRVILKHGQHVQAHKYLDDFARALTLAHEKLIKDDEKFHMVSAEYQHQLACLQEQITRLQQQLTFSNLRIKAIENSYSWRLTSPLRSVISNVLHLKNKYINKPQSSFKPYIIRHPVPCSDSRPRIVHALANFRTGGSSRLVVDLIEHLGHIYEQEVITSCIPDPQDYVGVNVHEYQNLNGPGLIIDYFIKYKPDLLHVHYWGDLDVEWYDKVFCAGKLYGSKIIENINTPVEPYFDASINSYVYVSKYVYDTFGKGHENNEIIYPGSNFEIFKRTEGMEMPDDCIGMVYRLEKDKLNEQSIDAFIKVVKQRPRTKVLIVGGGSYLEKYKNAARQNNVYDSFTFTDYVAYEDLPALYEQLSIFVVPVWKESFGQVSPFAMHMGIPVVGYDVGAISEIIGNDEFLAPPGDSDRLAEIIIGLLDDREKRLYIGAQNRKRASALFSVEAMIDAYASLYALLLR